MSEDLFNEDQRDHMRALEAIPRELRCSSGWHVTAEEPCDCKPPAAEVKPIAPQGSAGDGPAQAFTSGGPGDLAARYKKGTKETRRRPVDGSLTFNISPDGKGGGPLSDRRAIPGGGTGQNSGYLFRTEDGYAKGDEAQKTGTGTSIFDPVLCELAYRWFCPPGGMVLDPFSGGSVRGIVASALGRRYTGIDLSERQVEANRQQAEVICRPRGWPVPVWHVGDAINAPRILEGERYDFLFTCPPYADLEVYSDDPRDLSTMPYPEFRRVYKHIITQCVALLKPNRFAGIVVGEVRDVAGHYYGFVPDTIQFFREAGVRYYDEAGFIPYDAERAHNPPVLDASAFQDRRTDVHLYNEFLLTTAVGSLPIRTGKQFSASRKIGKTHQNFLVFVRGDAKKATKECEDYTTMAAT